MSLLHTLAIASLTILGIDVTALPIVAVFAANQQGLAGIYLTSDNVATGKADATIDAFRAVGGNMVIFDVQDSGGLLAYPSNLPLSIELNNRRNKIPDLIASVNNFKEKGFYTVARFVLFKNTFLAAKKPQWTLKRRGTNSPFVSRDGPIWIDPTNPEAKEYLIALAREIAAAGVDEIQFDYVRFPDGPRPGTATYSYTDEKTLTRDQAITSFLAAVAPEIRQYGTKVGVDMFGIVVWDNVSWKLIGQNVHEVAKHVDAIYPMPYPSHFGPGWGGHKNPADEPYFFVQETTKKFIEQAYPSYAEIRPWLQGFSMRVTNYGPQYVQEQIRALDDIGIKDYAIWNASNNYNVTLKGYKK